MFFEIYQYQFGLDETGKPGLVVMGGDKGFKGHEFESPHCILDGHFFSYVFVLKFVKCV